MKLGISVRIDVTKIEKARLYQGEKGVYLDLTTFIDTNEKDQWGNNGFISQSVEKDEREQGVKTPILGNCKVFYQGEGAQQAEVKTPAPSGGDNFNDDIPFAGLKNEYCY